ncbi:hypothetical protein TanjilG_23127 [Lupinus angustifolius]|uniref:Uncharacterized protein n=1 Tax=Lupinus angustifolius TaxID=3871 RepID=A0A394DLI2_LUPAN|nr:hypothetical protein TanjilG_23127 [Lupinus angustifolius]
MSRPPHAPPRQLFKHQSWSPDMIREEAWQRRKESHFSSRYRLSKSLSNADLEELKACIELGFGFDSPKIDPKLSNTIPALELYLAVNKQYNSHSLSRSSSTSSFVSESDTSSSNNTIFNPVGLQMPVTLYSIVVTRVSGYLRGDLQRHVDT